MQGWKMLGCSDNENLRFANGYDEWIVFTIGHHTAQDWQWSTSYRLTNHTTRRSLHSLAAARNSQQNVSIGEYGRKSSNYAVTDKKKEREAVALCTRSGEREIFSTPIFHRSLLIKLQCYWDESVCVRCVFLDASFRSFLSSTCHPIHVLQN